MHNSPQLCKKEARGIAKLHFPRASLSAQTLALPLESPLRTRLIANGARDMLNIPQLKEVN